MAEAQVWMGFFHYMILAYTDLEELAEALMLAATQFPKDDYDTVLAHSSGVLLTTKRSKLEDVVKILFDDVFPCCRFEQWDSVKEMTLRILECFRLNIDHFAKWYQEELRRLSFIQFIEVPLKEKIDHTQDVCKAFIDVFKISSKVEFQNASSEAANDDHSQLPDGMNWPAIKAELESKLPLVSYSAIRFRGFRMKTLPVEDFRSGVLHSAIVATRVSLKRTYGHAVPVLIENFTKALHDVEELFQHECESGALARVGHEIQIALRALDSKYQVGVILPGETRIFFPGRLATAKPMEVYIKANRVLRGDRWEYRFDGVHRGRNSRQATVQTRAFSELPPEIRCRIYREIIRQDWEYRDMDRALKKQPAISFTSREINREIMPLLARKYGFFVCTDAPEVAEMTQ